MEKLCFWGGIAFLFAAGIFQPFGIVGKDIYIFSGLWLFAAIAAKYIFK